tara:strand:+ start:336 stop:578 length:243 start_codon:yes stop_codon:yes gene_type:complete
MAFVVSISPDEREFRNTHPTELQCRYVVGERDGKKVLQLNSYGSSNREIPEKLSQTLQFGEHAARQLFDLLRAEYGFGER